MGVILVIGFVALSMSAMSYLLATSTRKSLDDLLFDASNMKMKYFNVAPVNASIVPFKDYSIEYVRSDKHLGNVNSYDSSTEQINLLRKKLLLELT